MAKHDAALLEAIEREARPAESAGDVLESLLGSLEHTRFVLIGEASHGTHEFYQARAEMTQHLIVEHGFNAIAVEADWPDAYRVDRYVRGVSEDQDADEALSGFKRFPTWMWRNTVVLEFVEELRKHNEGLPPERKAGFYGLDLYSLQTSIEEVLRYLDKVDPEAAQRARYRYGCFEHFGEDVQAYGYAAGFGLTASCERAVVAQLTELRRRAAEYAQRDGRVAEEAFFTTEQNARLVRNAERYYRSMFRGREESWNLRDRHMAETLEAVAQRLDRPGRPAKVVVWAHNSHLGVARATQMGAAGELNLGQLVREQYGSECMSIGFTTNHGTVSAASGWGGPLERKAVRPALPESYEGLFHRTQRHRFHLWLRAGSSGAVQGLREQRLERAIGVIYLPRSERASHYFLARLPDQFDIVIHFDETRAVEPLERTSGWDVGEEFETFPSGV